MPGGMATTLRVTGLNEMVRGLTSMGVEVDDLKDGMARIARQGAILAARYAPVGATGRLRGDIRGNRAKAKAVVTAGRVSVPYAGPINYGWKGRNIQGAFFMQKASDQLEPFAPFLLQTEISRLIVRKGIG